MTIKCRLRLFRKGRNQVLRIPRTFELLENEAILRKQGERPILEGAPSRRLLNILRQLPPIEEEFPHIIRQRP